MEQLVRKKGKGERYNHIIISEHFLKAKHLYYHRRKLSESRGLERKTEHCLLC